MLLICDHLMVRTWGETCLILPPFACTDGRMALSVDIMQLLLKFKNPFPLVIFEKVGSWPMHLVARLVLSLIAYNHPFGDQIYSSAYSFCLTSQMHSVGSNCIKSWPSQYDLGFLYMGCSAVHTYKSLYCLHVFRSPDVKNAERSWFIIK